MLEFSTQKTRIGQVYLTRTGHTRFPNQENFGFPNRATGFPNRVLLQVGSDSGFPLTRIGLCAVHPNRAILVTSARPNSLFRKLFQNQVIHSKGIFFFEDMMSREIVSMGSESRPLVLVMGEYA
ncbi:hypothetical protein OSB04_007459 [Centaurea solstitialis]|uniref:Uncharacterized protein n=1 Tax=Centaurea solstitialis TaxID=347529 RepID=A0AA38TLL9_9ASTR|nr:hypothetical protein OSB04_007459 [Centaurea solstitialis]